MTAQYEPRSEGYLRINKRVAWHLPEPELKFHSINSLPLAEYQTAITIITRWNSDGTDRITNGPQFLDAPSRDAQSTMWDRIEAEIEDERSIFLINERHLVTLSHAHGSRMYSRKTAAPFRLVNILGYGTALMVTPNINELIGDGTLEPWDM